MIGPKEIGQEAEVRNLEEMNRGQELQLTLSRPRAERRARVARALKDSIEEGCEISHLLRTISIVSLPVVERECIAVMRDKLIHQLFLSALFKSKQDPSLLQRLQTSFFAW